MTNGYWGKRYLAATRVRSAGSSDALAKQLPRLLMGHALWILVRGIRDMTGLTTDQILRAE